MNRMLWLAVSLIFFSFVSLSYSQSAPPTSRSPRPKPTPTIQGQARTTNQRSFSTASSQSSNTHAVSLLLRKQMRRVQLDRKSGKLSAAQAQAMKEKLRTIRQKELGFFRQNGKKQITDDQKNQLITQLNGNESAL